MTNYRVRAGVDIDRKTIEEATHSVLRKATDSNISEYQVRMAVSRKLGIMLINPKYKAMIHEAIVSFDPNRDVFICDLSGKARVSVQYRGNDPLDAILWIRKFKNAEEERRRHPQEEISITNEEWMALKRNVSSIDRAARKEVRRLCKWVYP